MTFGTTGIDIMIGTDLADSLLAKAGDDELHGKAGNDLLSGEDGNDQMFGDEGNDLLFGGLDVGRDSDFLDGGSGIDTVTYGQVQHGMFVDLFLGSAGAQLPELRGPIDRLVSIESVNGTNFNDTLTGDGGANSLSGSGGIDSINGDGGNDKLSGGIGGDVLFGGFGVDKLTGGAGADSFGVRELADSGVGLGKRDVITDFGHAQGDKIDLLSIDAKVGTAGDQTLSFIGEGGFNAEGQVRFFFEGDHTVVALNTSGTSGAESQIELAGNITLSEADFIL